MKSKDKLLWNKAKKIIPGGTMLLSKNPDRYLKNYWPAYFAKAKDCTVWTIDQNKYFDLSSMSVGTNILGYSNSKINNAVIKTIKKSNISSLNSPTDVYLAKELIKMNPWAGAVRFAKSGGEALAIAIRLARATSKKDNIAFCGYHGWHDWYLSSNLQNKKNLNKNLLTNLPIGGVPKSLKNTAFPFLINSKKSFDKAINRKNVGCVIMEVFRNIETQVSFLRYVKKICSQKKIILIFDECTSAFRETYGGIYKKYNINPDMVMYGKALGNGFPISAIVGRKSVMRSFDKTFISSTFWTENTGSVAALETLKEMKKIKSWLLISKKGRYVKKNWLRIANKHNIKIKITGLDAMPKFEFDQGNNNQLKNFLCKEMLKRGFLFKDTIYISVAHKEHIIKKYLKAFDEIFGLIKIGKINKKLNSFNDFKRLN